MEPASGRSDDSLSSARVGGMADADCRSGQRLFGTGPVQPCIQPGRKGLRGHTRDGLLSVPHLGHVVLGDDVEVGANTTLDRGSTGDTVIGAGSRLDNLVQIGHNVDIGRCCVVVAQMGIAGSAMLGDFVQVSRQAAIAGHICIGQGDRIGAQAGVMSDMSTAAKVVVSPAQSRREFFRQVAFFRRMGRRAP